MKLPPCITDLSRLTCSYCTGENISWCGMAWRQSSVSVFWRLWVFAFGVQHCAASYEFYDIEG